MDLFTILVIFLLQLLISNSTSTSQYVIPLMTATLTLIGTLAGVSLGNKNARELEEQRNRYQREQSLEQRNYNACRESYTEFLSLVIEPSLIKSAFNGLFGDEQRHKLLFYYSQILIYGSSDARDSACKIMQILTKKENERLSERLGTLSPQDKKQVDESVDDAKEFGKLVADLAKVMRELTLK